MSAAAWVAFDAEGIAYGFATKSRHTLKQAAREFPDANRIELIDDEDEVRRLIGLWCNGTTSTVEAAP